MLQRSENRPLAERVRHLAAEWLLPVEWVAAACRAAGVPCESLPGVADVAADELAQDLLAWQRDYLSFTPGSPVSPPGPPALRLRELYRAIYCDDDQLRHILMLLAAQHLRLFGPDAGREQANEMLNIFVPVAEMLGMYHVRRAWVEQCMHILREASYVKLAKKMGIDLDEPTSEYIEDAVACRQLALPSPPATASLPPVKEPPMPLGERWHLFTSLSETLDAALRQGWGDRPRPHIELVPYLPGRVLFRGDEVSPADSPQLVIRLICRTREDCYNALGAVHAVCPPIGSGQGTALRDYIGSPRTNGYRTLQTLCLWTHPTANGSASRVINVHILTEEMRELNEWGVLAGRRPRHSSDGRPETWWKRLDKSSKGLLKRSGTPATGVADYVHHHLPGTTSHPIYCFTPVGEVLWLDEGSTALDFAHRIHSRLVRHTARIYVNGDDVPFDTALRNGDLVQVDYDLSQSLVDFCWQDQVKSKRARARIRTALRKRAALIHSGYERFETNLIHQMDVYAGGRGDKAYAIPACSSAEIMQFLRRAGLRHSGGSLEALYEQMAAKPSLVDKLAHRFISERVIPDLRLAGGQPLQPYPGHIYVCSHCRPAPVDTGIEGRLTRGRTLVIHRRDCRYASPISQTLDLEWAPETPPDAWPLYHFEINTRDFDGLLNNVLRLVYDIPHTYLFHVSAKVNEMRRATVDLHVAVKLPQICRDLKRQFADLAEDTQVRYRALMDNRRRDEVHATDMSRRLDNPFVESEVTDWRFFGRDETINAILSWIYGKEFRSQLLLLHGQRRVGKSSLIGRLVAHELIESPSRKVQPVVVDFRNASIDQPHTMAELLVQQIFTAIDMPVPRLELYEDPIIWLDRHLLAAERRLKNKRLLVIVDEFDAGYSYFIARNRRPPGLPKLRAIIDSHPAIRWLLVVQTAYLTDPLLQAALPDLPLNVPQIAVRYLPRDVARRLIVDLSTHHGFQYAADPAHKQDLPDRIVDLTAGNPYFIHVLCRGLLFRAARERRNVILPSDLDRTVSEQLGYPVLFDHLFQPLRAEQQAIVRHIAALVPIGQRRPLGDVCKALALRLGHAPGGAAAQLALLEQIGVLEISGETPQQHVGIPIQLFHRWLLFRWIQ